MQNAALYESGFRNPIVVGSSSPFSDDSKQSIIIYAHYDVQPVDGNWTLSAPFEMKNLELEGYGEVLTGRGSQDCKGTSGCTHSGKKNLNCVSSRN